MAKAGEKIVLAEGAAIVRLTEADNDQNEFIDWTGVQGSIAALTKVVQELSDMGYLIELGEATDKGSQFILDVLEGDEFSIIQDFLVSPRGVLFLIKKYGLKPVQKPKMIAGRKLLSHQCGWCIDDMHDKCTDPECTCCQASLLESMPE